MNNLKHFLAAVFFVALALLASGQSTVQAAVRAPVTGEIEFITVNDPADHWSGGIIVVGGQNIIIPKNLLIDLPANRVTLQQLFVEAPAACVAKGETGLAKGDLCNTTGAGGFATISANVTAAGNTIAGDVLIDKGLEAVTGRVTHINYTDGYFVLNGLPGDPNTGVMVRLNDPTGRHTIQQGAGCVAGSENCSADPRFTLDPDNYTNGFTTGYPYCIPSTVTGGLRTAGADATGAGDPFCPDTNRTVNGGQPVNDSRFFAPVMVGDSILAEGSFETINGVKFLSAHSSTVAVALSTKADLNQPDYLFMAEVFMDAGGFKNGRARALFIGFSTGNTDMRMWTRFWDPAANEVHEFPLGSIAGCDRIAGPGSCGNVGLVAGGGGNIFKLRYDVDFLIDPTKKPELYPCSVISNDPEWANLNVCPGGGTVAENFAIMSPVPHEIHVRSRKKTDSEKPGGTALITQDIQGNEATNGEYIFPFGVNLGGIELPEFVEINLGAVQTPLLFTGLPWTLDRRLSPGGCIDTTGDGVPDCETGALGTLGLDPFPFEGINPTTFETTLPVGAYSAQHATYTASQLSDVRNRILSYVTEVAPGVFNFNGDNTILPWPPADPAFIAITPTPIAAGNTAPVITSTPSATATTGTAYSYQVVATDTPGDVLAFALASAPTGMGISASGLITWTPAANQTGAATVNVTAIDRGGLAATQNFTIQVTAGTVNAAPAITSAPGTAATAGTAYSYQVTATDAAGTVFTYALTSAPAGMGISAAGLITWTPTAPQVGAANVTVSVTDQGGLAATQSFTITVIAPPSNTAPTITSLPLTTATTGAAYSYQVAVADTTGDTFTYSLPTAPAGMTISTTGLITWTPTSAQAGANPVAVQATDQGGLSATQNFSVTVTVVIINTAPAITSAPVTTALAGAAYSYQVAVTDTPGDTFTFSLPTAPAGMTVSTAGLVTWTPGAAQAGFNSVTVQVTDQGGLSATQTFAVNVALTDTIIVRLSEYRTNRLQWRVSGTASPSLNQTLTIAYDDGSAVGTVLGTAIVINGVWTLDVRNAAGLLVPPASGATRLRVTSPAGGTATAAIAIRR